MDKWIDRNDTEPSAFDTIEMKLGEHVWVGKIWQACPALHPVDSAMPTHWRPLSVQRFAELGYGSYRSGRIVIEEDIMEVADRKFASGEWIRNGRFAISNPYYIDPNPKE